MAAKPNTPQSINAQETRARRAYAAITDIRSQLYRRLCDFILANKNRLRDEASGEDSYSFTLQQLDEQFLNKLNIIERTMGELSRCEHRDGQTTTTTYEAVEVIAKRDELPQKVAEALAEHSESDFLDLCVLRCDERQAEVLLVMAREENDSIATPVRTEKSEQGGEQGEDLSGGASGSES